MPDFLASVLPAIILCGGRGTRLRPATDRIPKALALLNGRPILDHVLDLYRSRGLKRFVLCVGYRGEDIHRHFEQPPPDICIQFSDLGEEASMLRRIWAVRDCFDSRALVSYGDTFADLDLNGLCANHHPDTALATIVVASIRNPFGLVSFDGDRRVISFSEKPLLHYYIGHFLLERRALDFVSPEMLGRPDGEGLVELFETLIANRRLAVFEHRGLQITFNTEPERRQAERQIRHFFTLREDT